jgi:ubiquinone/menaquinone biosynthesis C-methylase UbiE
MNCVWLQKVRRRLRRLLNQPPLAQDNYLGSEIVDGKGHRQYVGGLWEPIGTLQFNFMVKRGLRPQHVLLDIACGSLRGGVHFIPYLDRGNYLGIDIKQQLIDAGINNELGLSLYQQKKPEFVVSEAFEFERLSKKPDFAIAQSLFTHLIERDILLCLTQLRNVAKQNTKFYATFFESREPIKNSEQSHPHLSFLYTRQQMIHFGEATNWIARYIGDWNHPRNQMMFEFSISPR